MTKNVGLLNLQKIKRGEIFCHVAHTKATRVDCSLNDFLSFCCQRGCSSEQKYMAS